MSLSTTDNTVFEEGVQVLTEHPWARRLPWWLKAAHVAIIGNLGAQSLYAGFQVFVVLQPQGTLGPMFLKATAIDPELMFARRLYAIEAWLAFGALALYLGITEILPRRRPGL